MKSGKRIVEFSVDHPWLITAIVIIMAIIMGIQFPKVKIDTDPENMLSEEEFVRVFHNRTKLDFTLHSFIILGIVNESHPEGVFNPDTLGKIYNITEEIKTIDGVISYDLMSPSTIDNISQAGPGAVRFEWLMGSPPEDMEEALRIRDEAKDNPMLDGTLVSEDGKAIGIYIPIERKDISYRVSQNLRKIVETYKGDERYYITGLPVAEDTFGVDMFKQMALSAPLAGMIIFGLMWYFFRKATLITSPMLVAVFSIIYSMGLLIGMGYTVHIMSSMIPIFLMPIAVVDSVHILSQFFDQYQITKDRRSTILNVMTDLFRPMLFTSLTTMAGFGSLAFTPIPPVRVFGIFVASGVMIAWILSMTFIPAYIMLMKEESLKGFGTNNRGESTTILTRILGWIGRSSYSGWKGITALTIAVMALSVFGITRININDNPVKWFKRDHPIRIADKVLNRHFGGTYTAYLVMEEERDREGFEQMVKGVINRLILFSDEEGIDPAIADRVKGFILSKEMAFAANGEYNITQLLTEVSRYAEERLSKAVDAITDSWELILDFIDEEKAGSQIFKQPEVIRYIEGIQELLLKTGIVGKSTSLADVVKKVHYELMDGDKRYNIIPDTNNAVAQILISFQNSHDPDDLWHFVTQDYSKANIWVQLKSGDNKDMERVVEAVDRYIKDNPPPGNIKAGWAGLTYLNVVWQNKMVRGMINSLLGSFVIVFIMMVFLNRSFLWGFLAMIPLSVTITFIYGLVGIAGKDYDMPIAVLSSLTLGLSIDFAIHFLERARAINKDTGSWKVTIRELFSEPARAIYRNAVIIAMGFLPLLAAPLVPYKTVGFFLFSIMAVSGIATLFILPALITGMEKVLFKD